MLFRSLSQKQNPPPEITSNASSGGSQIPNISVTTDNPHRDLCMTMCGVKR